MSLPVAVALVVVGVALLLLGVVVDDGAGNALRGAGIGLVIVTVMFTVAGRLRR